jgi:hypothetical protein
MKYHPSNDGTVAITALSTALAAAEKEPTTAGAIAAFLRRLPVAEGEVFHNVLMNRDTMDGIAAVVTALDPNAENHRPAPTARAVPGHAP